MSISRVEVEQIAEMAADKAARRILTDLGIEHESPYEMQADMNYLRDLRKSCDQVKGFGLRAAIGIVVAALFGALWLGLKGLIAH